MRIVVQYALQHATNLSEQSLFEQILSHSTKEYLSPSSEVLHKKVDRLLVTGDWWLGKFGGAGAGLIWLV